MSQRRGGSAKESGGGAVHVEEVMPFSKVLEGPAPNGIAGGMDRESNDVLASQAAPNLSAAVAAAATATATTTTTTTTLSNDALQATSIDTRYRIETEQIRTKQWQDSYFARGRTLGTWEAEYAQLKDNGWRGECNRMINSKDHTSLPCGCCSAILCSALGAGRVGNMAVFKQSTVWVTEEVPDLENGGTKTERFTRPQLDFVAGPYWPMLCMVTYPLILGVSGVVLVTVIPRATIWLGLLWAICTIGLIVALAMTAFRDPGILPRYSTPPPNQEEHQWRWNDRALTYRPRGAWYDPDTGVIVEGFDHTCPWTGTAIGKKNMVAFQFFVTLVFVCLVFDIILLTGFAVM